MSPISAIPSSFIMRLATATVGVRCDLTTLADLIKAKSSQDEHRYILVPMIYLMRVLNRKLPELSKKSMISCLEMLNPHLSSYVLVPTTSTDGSSSMYGPTL